MNQVPLFDIPFYQETVHNWQDIKAEFLSKIDWKEEECEVEPGTYSDYFKYYRRGDVPDYFWSLMDLLKTPLEKFSIRYPGAHVENAWCQRYSHSACHPAHNHGALGFSAVFYAQLTEDSSPTSFFSPVQDPWSGMIANTMPDAREGDIIFFPSYLIHQSLPHYGERDKIIFSFNLARSSEQITL